MAVRPLAMLSVVSGLVFAIAASSAKSADIDAAIEALVPRLEAYVSAGMTAFDNPGLAIGIVADDKLVYAKGFGVRSKGGQPVDTETVFQIGSTTKAFLATTMAIGVDRGHFGWDDRIVDLYPDFQLKDPWVTQEFRLFDMIAQRSGLPAYANDMLSMLGLDRSALIRSLRHVDPVSSFRSTFAYTNITHLVAGRIVAKAAGLPDWEAVVRAEIFEPLSMDNSSTTAAAIEAAPNHAVGHAWAPEGTTEVPFTELFPYAYDGAGAINSNVTEMARWLRLLLGDGTFEGTRIVSPENLAVTRMARVGLNDKLSYAMGWILQSTPNGQVVWHNGGTPSFGAFVGLSPDHGFGVVVLTNESNVGFPDAVGLWVMDRLLGNPDVDLVAEKLAHAKAGAEDAAKAFAPPQDPAPFPVLDPLAGTFANPATGDVKVARDGDTLAMAFAGGAKLVLTPWDGGIFTVTLKAEGDFAGLAANLGPAPTAFAQFQTDQTGQLNLLRLTFTDGQVLGFTRQ